MNTFLLLLYVDFVKCLDYFLGLRCRKVIKQYSLNIEHIYIIFFEDVPLVEFIYLVFTRMSGESYRRRLMSLLLYLCYIIRALINSLIC